MNVFYNFNSSSFLLVVKRGRWDTTVRLTVRARMLVLLPTESAKLFAKWQGPYEITRRVSKVDYEVNMVDKKKKLQVLHANLLKLWVDRETLFGDCERDGAGTRGPF